MSVTLCMPVGLLCYACACVCAYVRYVVNGVIRHVMPVVLCSMYGWAGGWMDEGADGSMMAMMMGACVMFMYV